jgi:hypothetical protein
MRFWGMQGRRFMFMRCLGGIRESIFPRSGLAYSGGVVIDGQIA